MPNYSLTAQPTGPLIVEKGGVLSLAGNGTASVTYSSTADGTYSSVPFLNGFARANDPFFVKATSTSGSPILVIDNSPSWQTLSQLTQDWNLYDSANAVGAGIATTSTHGYSAFPYVCNGTNDTDIIERAIADMTAAGRGVVLASGSTFTVTRPIVPTCDFIGGGSTTRINGSNVQGPILQFGGDIVSFTGSISGTTLTVTGGIAGQTEICVGIVLTGTGVASGTKITELISGTGQTGTYKVSISHTNVSSTTISSVGNVLHNKTVGNFMIGGSTTRNSAKWRWFLKGKVLPIWSESTGCVDTFDISYTFGNNFDQLTVDTSSLSISASNSNVRIWDYGNSNVFNQIYTSSFTPIGLLTDTTLAGSADPDSNTFNTLIIQGATTGCWFKAAQASTCNSIHFENVVNNVQFGDKANNKVCRALTMNSPMFQRPYLSHPSISSAVAMMDFDNANGITINSPEFAIGALNTTVTFTGGTAVIAAIGVAIINASGVVQSIQIINGGAYSVAPTGVTLSSATGSGFTITSIQTSGSSPNITVTGVTINNPGTGYKMALDAAIPTFVVYGQANRCVINRPYTYYGAPGGGPAIGMPLYPWICRKATGDSASGVEVTGDVFNNDLGNNYYCTADYRRLPGWGYNHAVIYWNSSGTQQALIRVPPLFS